MSSRAPSSVGLLFVLAGAALGCATSSVVGRTPEGAPIVKIPLRLSNAYLVKGKVPVLIDTGTLGDMNDLTEALADNGVKVAELRLIIVTHAHADHAGLALDLRGLSQATILLGRGDVDLARDGHNDDLKPTSFMARLLKAFVIPSIFPAFEADYAVGEPFDLSPWGIGGKVIAMPGHTLGSLVVVLSNRSAFVGDEILGGSFGGELWPHSPGEHYFHADAEQNRRNIARLVEMGIETFYLGHGGPVAREDVIKAFAL